MTLYNWIKNRESGLKPELGGYDSIYKSLYNAISPFDERGSSMQHEQMNKTYERSEFGGVFNLEFNDG